MLEAFTGHLCHDSLFSALAELWGLLRDNEAPPVEALSAAYREWDEVLGLGLSESRRAEACAVDDALAVEIEALVSERGAAKKAKDWLEPTRSGPNSKTRASSSRMDPPALSGDSDEPRASPTVTGGYGFVFK